MSAGHTPAGIPRVRVGGKRDRESEKQGRRAAGERWTEYCVAEGRGKPGHRYRLVAVVEYDGTDYAGFQLQRERRTVQGELEDALASVAQQRVRIVGAGRTDAGVHATGQVVHFAVRWAHPLAELHRALNAVLAADVALIRLRVAPPGFHARYSARSREYVYTVYTGAVRSPLVQRYSYHDDRAIETEAMQQACDRLLGTHDFRAFGSAPSGDNTVRTVRRAECTRAGDYVRVLIEADAFLRRMVRRIVGNLLLVGAGELELGGFAELLQWQHLQTPAAVAPPQGLCLTRVNY
jgi:tRNA pseudouridine38-40 synthase